MHRSWHFIYTAAVCLAGLILGASPVHADGDLRKVNHIVVITQEGHSFDNYLGVLPYVSGTPYHPGPCKSDDHRCVDGLTCTAGKELVCTNSNLAEDSSPISSFHQTAYCTADLDHSWPGSHLEGNFTFPNMMPQASPNDGFVRQTESKGGAGRSDHATMGFYTAKDLPFYFYLAENFALGDRYFSSLAGPAFPNHSYQFAATSFGHLTDNELFAPPGGYKPATGTIFDLLDRNNVSWANYFGNFATSSIFRGAANAHLRSIAAFLDDAEAGKLPAVSFVDPTFTFTTRGDDEHSPSDVRAGEAYVARLVQAVRDGPDWKDSIIFITYDQNGGYYDHVAPPMAKQNGLTSPDGIDPGLCEDSSDPPMSMMPGGGANCVGLPSTGHSFEQAANLCPLLVRPNEAYPSFCANFNQLGFRVPLIAVSPFSKPHYVSHAIGDHTSLLALIEERFLSSANRRQHLTARDQNAATLSDMFDFSRSPSSAASIPVAPAASSRDPGCG